MRHNHLQICKGFIKETVVNSRYLRKSTRTGQGNSDAFLDLGQILLKPEVMSTVVHKGLFLANHMQQQQHTAGSLTHQLHMGA